jgi:hypothetical protein
MEAAMTLRSLLILGVALWTVVSLPAGVTPAERLADIRRAQVWTSRDVAAFDFIRGDGDFAPGAKVVCDYVSKQYGGRTPKFGCSLAPGDDVKVKYGETNSEVYAGVAATRLLRALGFGVDALFPVSIDCRGCPDALGGTPAGPNVSHFSVAAIERKLKGKDVKVGKEDGWNWSELDLVDPAAGGAPRAQRDALKLLAVFLQHTDNKKVQQRLLCLPVAAAADPAPPCERPFMMIHDLGNTFGKANRLNRAAVGGVNLANWSTTPIWKDARQCVGNLSKSFTGNLSNPRITEEGRKFLADLLVQLTDAQLHDLFTVAHFARGPARMRAPTGSAEDTVAAWVAAFKHKRDEIVQAHCPS